MHKKSLIAVLALALALSLAAACSLAEFDGGGSYTQIVSSDTMYMYVYTDNGQGLNVRSAPFVGNNIIGVAHYGAQVEVKRFLDNGWACIQWDVFTEGYVQSRFLQWYEPSTFVPTPAPTPVVTAVPYSYTDTLAELNAEFRTARLVTPFTIIVRPSRSSGWVNMRWAPSKDTEVLATYRSGAKLTVIAETYSWYQVVDADTEATGFIMKAYTTRQN